MTEYCVKGSSIRTKFEYVEARFGVNAKDKMIAHFQSRHKDLFPILNISWYSFDTFVEVLEYIAHIHFEGDFAKLEDIGTTSARKTLTTTYASFVANNDFLRFLDKFPTLHSVLYNLGRIDIKVHANKKGCDIIQRGQPRYSKADLYVASGFYQEAARFHDLSDVRCSFEQKNNEVHFSLSWK